MQPVGDSLKRVRRGFLFGFSAVLGGWVAIVVLTILAMLILRPWG